MRKLERREEELKVRRTRLKALLAHADKSWAARQALEADAQAEEEINAVRTAMHASSLAVAAEAARLDSAARVAEEVEDSSDQAAAHVTLERATWLAREAALEEQLSLAQLRLLEARSAGSSRTAAEHQVAAARVELEEWQWRIKSEGDVAVLNEQAFALRAQAASDNPAVRFAAVARLAMLEQQRALLLASEAELRRVRSELHAAEVQSTTFPHNEAARGRLHALQRTLRNREDGVRRSSPHSGCGACIAQMIGAAEAAVTHGVSAEGLATYMAAFCTERLALRDGGHRLGVVAARDETADLCPAFGLSFAPPSVGAASSALGVEGPPSAHGALQHEMWIDEKKLRRSLAPVARVCEAALSCAPPTNPLAPHSECERCAGSILSGGRGIRAQYVDEAAAKHLTNPRAVQGAAMLRLCTSYLKERWVVRRDLINGTCHRALGMDRDSTAAARIMLIDTSTREARLRDAFGLCEGMGECTRDEVLRYSSAWSSGSLGAAAASPAAAARKADALVEFSISEAAATGALRRTADHASALADQTREAAAVADRSEREALAQLAVAREESALNRTSLSRLRARATRLENLRRQSAVMAAVQLKGAEAARAEMDTAARKHQQVESALDQEKRGALLAVKVAQRDVVRTSLGARATTQASIAAINARIVRLSRSKSEALTVSALRAKALRVQESEDETLREVRAKATLKVEQTTAYLAQIEVRRKAEEDEYFAISSSRSAEAQRFAATAEQAATDSVDVARLAEGVEARVRAAMDESHGADDAVAHAQRVVARRRKARLVAHASEEANAAAAADARRFLHSLVDVASAPPRGAEQISNVTLKLSLHGVGMDSMTLVDRQTLASVVAEICDVPITQVAVDPIAVVVENNPRQPGVVAVTVGLDDKRGGRTRSSLRSAMEDAIADGSAVVKLHAGGLLLAALSLEQRQLPLASSAGVAAVFRHGERQRVVTKTTGGCALQLLSYLQRAAQESIQGTVRHSLQVFCTATRSSSLVQHDVSFNVPLCMKPLLLFYPHSPHHYSLPPARSLPPLPPCVAVPRRSSSVLCRAKQHRAGPSRSVLPHRSSTHCPARSRDAAISACTY